MISVLGGAAALLRPGAISREAIELVLGGPLAAAKANHRRRFAGTACDSLRARPRRFGSTATSVAPDEALLAFGRDVPEGARLTINLSAGGNLEEAASRLFAALRELDQAGAAAIAVMPIPAHGLGEAINDRLQRAANQR